MCIYRYWRTPPGGGNSSAPSAAHIAALCGARAVDAQLLHNSSESAAVSLLERGHLYVTATRVCSCAVVVSAGAAGLMASWQHRRVYRVWRLRHPRRVAQQRLWMWSLAAGCVAAALFMASPVGFTALHAAGRRDVRRLDAIAVRALVLGRKYTALMASASSGASGAAGAGLAREFEHCEDEWAALVRERTEIDENV